MFQKYIPQMQGEREQLLAAARQCDRAAHAIGTQEEMAEIMRIFQHKEQVEKALTLAALDRYAQSAVHQEERLPLRCEGDDIGRIEARIPSKLFYGLFHQKNFGHDGFCSDDGMRDFGKQYPQFMVKTISGKTTVGFRAKNAKEAKRKQGVIFGRGTITFAN